ncbi:MAG: DUF5060 domain-containing protein [Armatimonadetes bacterium]|nr:DUF5060 domain-containing protein [Armatimonadota bacterium]MDW8121783.1 DUF5060 domain-containing protein [Armatimonadota bacterium]
MLAAWGALQQIEVEFTAEGGITQIRRGGEVLLQSLALVLVKPGWKGTYDLQDASGPATPLLKPTGQFRFRLEGDGADVLVNQSVTVKKSTLSLSYRLLPKKPVLVETVMVRGFLPTVGNAGASRWVAISRQSGAVLSHLFPLRLPQPYHLLNRNDLDELGWQLPSGWGLIFSFENGVSSVTLQDDRQFGSEVFEVQIHLDRDHLRLGREVSAELTLSLLSPSEFADWERKAKKEAEGVKSLLTMRSPLSLRTLTPVKTPIPCYETLEVALELKGTYDNPFDPEQISVEGEVWTPSGDRMRIPGFFTVPFRLERRNGQERLLVNGSPHFAVRFTPRQVGRHQIRFVADGYDENLKKRTVVTPWYPLEVTVPRGKKGFVRRGPFWHLEFEDGTPFVPVGLNLCWSGNRLEPYRRWLSAMKGVGANFARIWLVPWNMGLEWKEGDGSGRFLGLGKYALDNAWRLDQLIRMAEENGVYLMLCLGYHGELADQPLYFGEQAWERSPYNIVNGGPCAKPSDFWTHPEAIRLYQQKLRYLIARTAHSPNVLAYEFWNEVLAPAHWIEKMAQFFRQTDPYDHLLTTTYGDDAVWKLKEMDFSQTHWYGEGSQLDCSNIVHSFHNQYTQRFAKPFLLGEFGIDWKATDLQYDPKGEALHWHNGLWSSLFSRGLGTACVWYWDSYVDALNLWHRFRPIATFVRMVGSNWKRDWKIAQTDVPVFVAPQTGPLTEVVFRPSLSWQRPTAEFFTVHRSGRIVADGESSVFLFSPSKPDLYRPPRFQVDFPQDGYMIIRVHTVSSGAVLIVRCDGKEIFRQPLPEGELKKDEQGRPFREGSYKEKRWDQQWKKWDYIYDQDWRVPIPAGKHLIELDNQGADWCTIPVVTFTPYRNPQYAPVDVIGVQCEDQALLWVHHQESHYQNLLQGKLPDRLPEFSFTLTGLQDGFYQILFWDTWEGRTIKTEKGQSVSGVLKITVDGLQRDVALWIRRGDQKR